MTRAVLLNILKALVAVALIWWVIRQAGWENIRGTLSNIDLAHWLWGLAVILLGTCISIWRWQLLMRSVGIDASLAYSLRLGFIGVFFSNIVPGLTGGDLVKAIYVARDNHGRRADAVVTVIVDRVVGIVALALIAAVVIPFDLDRYREVALAIYGFLALSALGAVLVLSRRVKERLRRALEKLRRTPRNDGPGWLGKLDQAMSMYRDRLGVLLVSLAISIVVHLCIIAGCVIFGEALARGGLAAGSAQQAELLALQSLGFDVYCSIIPIIMIISALPIAPAGWGVGETAFVYFFGTVDIGQALAVALSLTFRLTSTLISLLGGLCLLADRRPVPRDPLPDP